MASPFYGDNPGFLETWERDDTEEWRIFYQEVLEKAFTNKMRNAFLGFTGAKLVGLTVTLSPKYQALSVGAQIAYTLPNLVKILNRSCVYVGVVELTQAGNVHYHLVLAIKDSIKWMASKPWLKIRETVGYCKVEHNLTNSHSWIAYLKKDLGATTMKCHIPDDAHIFTQLTKLDNDDYCILMPNEVKKYCGKSRLLPMETMLLQESWLD